MIYKRIFCFILGAGLVAAGFWLHGFDFNERGGEALTVYLMGLLVGGFLSALPGIRIC